MSYRTISEMFYQTTEKYADKHLYYEKKADQWQGLRGKETAEHDDGWYNLFRY